MEIVTEVLKPIRHKGKNTPPCSVSSSVCPECLYSAAHQKATDIWRMFQGKSLVLASEAKKRHTTIGSKKHFQFSVSPIYSRLRTCSWVYEKLNKQLDTIMNEAFRDGWFAEGGVPFHRLQRLTAHWRR